MGRYLGKLTACNAGSQEAVKTWGTRAHPGYLGWLWTMTWYCIKPKNQYPIMFARPTSREDLSVLMAYANKQSVQLVARSSGHNICNTCIVQDPITVDMSMFDEIGEIDTEGRTVWAGPRVLSEPLNRLLFEKGLAFPSAHTGFVTIGGYLLGGGMGWNMPNWGMGCASVLAAEVVDQATRSTQAIRSRQAFCQLS